MLRNNTSAEFIFALLQELSHAQAELFASVLWSLWKSRNLQLWQNEVETLQAIVARAQKLLVNWRVANSKRQQGGMTGRSADPITDVQQSKFVSSSVQIGQNRWQKPIMAG